MRLALQTPDEGATWAQKSQPWFCASRKRPFKTLMRRIATFSNHLDSSASLPMATT